MIYSLHLKMISHGIKLMLVSTRMQPIAASRSELRSTAIPFTCHAISIQFISHLYCSGWQGVWAHPSWHWTKGRPHCLLLGVRQTVILYLDYKSVGLQSYFCSQFSHEASKLFFYPHWHYLTQIYWMSMLWIVFNGSLVLLFGSMAS